MALIKNNSVMLDIGIIFFVEKYKTNNPIECLSIFGLLNIFLGLVFKTVE